MRLRHPYSLSEDSPPVDNYVHYGGRREVAEVDSDGTFVVPDSADQFVEAFAERHGYEPKDLIVDEDAGSTPDDDECGYYDEESMDAPCSRNAGWGRDADSGPCKDHVGG